MLKISQQTENGKIVNYLEGFIGEEVNFSSLVKNPGDVLHLDCLGVRRINSVGIKRWFQEFSDKTKYKKIYYHRISPVLVEQFNLISNFHCGGEVVSVLLPYLCRNCGKSVVFIRSKADLVNVEIEPAPWPCDSCDSDSLEFDDDVDGYLKFWG